MVHSVDDILLQPSSSTSTSTQFLLSSELEGELDQVSPPASPSRRSGGPPAKLMRSNTTGTIPNDSNLPSDKCRYKTGKCSNTRSFKRNGQQHMLCLFHREKANRIQRKFDRQKRQSSRLTGSSVKQQQSSSSSSSKVKKLPSFDTSPALNFAATINNSVPFRRSPAFHRSTSDLTGFGQHAPAMQRYSTGTTHSSVFNDAASAVANTNAGGVQPSFLYEDLWSSISNPSSMTTIEDDNQNSNDSKNNDSPTLQPKNSFGSEVEEERLSVDEIDFLCSAILA